MEEWRNGTYGTLLKLANQKQLGLRASRHLANLRIILHILQSSIGLKETSDAPRNPTALN
jgi:hypothetical protein